MIKIIKNKQEWGDLTRVFKASFLQSFKWGEILESLGQKVERIYIEEKGVKLIAQVVYKKLPFGFKYAQIHKGPVVVCEFVSDLVGKESLNELINYLRQKKCLFVRVEPSDLDCWPSGIRKRLTLIRDINPPATMILDLDKNEESLLKSFHSKTRYNINLAGRKKLTVSHDKNFEIFWDLFKKTGKRDNFILHPRNSYLKTISHPEVKQITIFEGDIPVASVCLIGSGETIYYLYGASDHKYRQLMAPYLAQWEAIKFGKNAGYKYYDFFGVAPRQSSNPAIQQSNTKQVCHRDDKSQYTYDPNHRYAGVSRFKTGFNGCYSEEPGTFELPLRGVLYEIYKATRILLSFRARFKPTRNFPVNAV